jgi:hypothetical protein
MIDARMSPRPPSQNLSTTVGVQSFFVGKKKAPKRAFQFIARLRPVSMSMQSRDDLARRMSSISTSSSWQENKQANCCDKDVRVQKWLGSD